MKPYVNVEDSTLQELKEQIIRTKEGEFIPMSKFNRLLKRMDAEISSLKEKVNTFRVDGNNDGNFFEVEKIDDKKIRLTVADCTVYTYDCIIPNEWLSAVLSDCHRMINKSDYKSLPKELLKQHGWGGKYESELIEMIEDKYERK